jgi:hypothetical protein
VAGRWKVISPSAESIGPGSGDLDLLAALDPLGEPMRLPRGRRPRGDRIVGVDQAGSEVEVLVVVEAHSRP